MPTTQAQEDQVLRSSGLSCHDSRRVPGARAHVPVVGSDEPSEAGAKLLGASSGLQEQRAPKYIGVSVFLSTEVRGHSAKGKCDHGRRKRACKECGTGRCKHGRQRGNCKECGTGRCQHGRQSARGASARSAARANASTGSGRATARTAARTNSQ
jgi:hypothetical protein